ncbi:DOMON-like domain-containing protein [Steroidobacter sp. S1-65]|uniref:DOMON-like domain-containing protein n=1 Tax=Steroidobacter gossypii TaxID=2805490 RepID=A0ABS1X2M2_9GAMM|nr:DOMON-like domain-containing protein [Steroidobacter gossypii]MBM0107459.1 DOMON-like domain-containing protein [Steroidobacter gossypii]
MHATALHRHPSTPDDILTGITVEVDSLTADLLVLYFKIAGDIDRLQLPAQAASKFQDELWKHTCLEAFLAFADSDVYYEFNFSPSSQWAVYRFDSYREGMTPLHPDPPPRVLVRRREGELDVDVDIHLGAIPGLTADELKGRELRLAVSAVMENDQGRVSYWALAHPPGKPDFHHRDGFALALDGGAAGESA